MNTIKQKQPLEKFLQLGVKSVAWLGSAQFFLVQLSDDTLSYFSGALITYSNSMQGRSMKHLLCAESLASQNKHE